MKMMNAKKTMVGMMVGGALLVACAPQKPSAEGDAPRQERAEDGAPGQDQVVARVNGEAITRAEFERRIESLAPHARARLQSPEQREDFLKSVVQFEVMADAAEEAGLGESPQVRHAMREVMVRLMLAEQLREEGGAAVGDEELQAYYDAHRADFARPARRMVYELVAQTREEAERLRRRFVEEAYPTTQEALNAFAELAGQYSFDRKTGDRSGARGWVEAGQPVAGAETMFETPVGQASTPYEDERGWVVAFVAEEEPARQPALSEVERELRTRVLEEKRRRLRTELVERLMAEATIEIDEDVLATVTPPQPELPTRLRDLPRLPVRDQGAGD
ncbi:hypothetical protein FRC98_14875 [Lujinxingia vulgaris]|uniref:PpiC domain-containing protein n=1 Tax=Lujinxingia vulgaris TaxID=2600176 RepID=A0A5C6X2A2_9DELT|nr:peptidylprolyl isomerase [Lujinxingia vulgaris]TXD35952.1 hypothetical protein FRC98_14875 [Lujinxingia vulgaris]